MTWLWVYTGVAIFLLGALMQREWEREPPTSDRARPFMMLAVLIVAALWLPVVIIGMIALRAQARKTPPTR